MDFKRCFLDVSINGKNLGRIVIKLFGNKVPRTAKNFSDICAGDKKSEETGNRLTYENCAVHRVIKNFILQSGDFEKGDGTGGESVYGRNFNDERMDIPFNKAGLVAMANAGPNTNGSQFFITCAPCPHLNGKHVVFGKVVSGMSVVRKIERVKVDSNNSPLKSVRIAKAGFAEKNPEQSEKSSGKPKKQTERPNKQLKETEQTENRKEKSKPLLKPITFIGKSGRILKGRGFTSLRHVGNFGGIGFHSETPSPERRRKEKLRRKVYRRREKPRYKIRRRNISKSNKKDDHFKDAPKINKKNDHFKDAPKINKKDDHFKDAPKINKKENSDDHIEDGEIDIKKQKFGKEKTPNHILKKSKNE